MSRCALCPAQHRCLPPDGPKGEVLFIGEAPGPQEDKGGRIFIGKTGQEVNQHYMPIAHLQRESCRVINAVACLPHTPQHKLDPKRQAHLDLLQSCAETHLYPEIEQNPTLKLLVPMGAIACRAIDPDIELDLQHGIPVQTRWGLPAFPMFHPARGLHEPKKMREIRDDWMRLRRYLAGTLYQPVDEYAEREDYAEITNPVELRSLDPTQPLACDTEHSRRLGPYCLTLSQAPGTGRLIRAPNRRVLDALQPVLDRWESDLLWHNWLYDAPVTQAMGLRFPHARIRDTMLSAYHLGNLPQGLKALAYRELGMVMEDFDDVVRPYSAERVLDYYRLANDIAWPKPEPQLVRDPQTQQWTEYKPHGMNTKLKRFFTDWSTDPEKDVFKMWEENWTEEQAMIEAELGPWPGIDIDHAPFERVLFYACRDVDALIRLWPILQHMRSRVGKVSQEQWRDVA